MALTADGAAEFVAAIDQSPAAMRAQLRRAYDWAAGLERDGVARLVTTLDARGWRVLKPFLLDEDRGLTTIWNDYLGSGPGWNLWRGVFSQRAPITLQRLEARIGPIPQYFWERDMDDDVLALVRDGYREAAGTSSPSAPRGSTNGASSSWMLAPGDVVLRSEMQAEYGGRVQGGMTTSRRSPNMFLFAEARVGERLGYFDGWEGVHFHYTGKGRKGDQELKDMNLKLLQHAELGLAIRLFRAEHRMLTYLGQFALDAEQPVYRTDAPQEGRDELRQVLVFKLVPDGDVLRDPRDSRRLPEGLTAEALETVLEGGTPIVDVVPVEQQHVTEAVARHSAEPVTVRRREQPLVHALREYLEARGSEVVRVRVVPSGEANAISNDLYDRTRNNLIEAKATGSREAVRMALGQVLDYGRFAREARRGVLLPTRPRRDLEDLLLAYGVYAVWPDGDGFADNCDGAFT